jgi:MFS transporter, BCD family, chlorophyll transporter
MNIVSKVFVFLTAVVKTLRLALPKLGVGWMFALLTVNFNFVTIHELNVTAVAVTAMLAIHYALSPFQVVMGRVADRFPIFGLRRTPYLLIAATIASIAFLGLPSVAFGMGEGSGLAYLAGFGILITFGVCIAIMGDSHHSLIAEVTSPETRGGVISVVWTFTILSTIIAAVVFGQVMPEYNPADMQSLYNLTPFIVIISAAIGVIGIEKRLTGDELREALATSRRVAPEGNPIHAATTVLRENKQAWGFFAFIFVSILSIFLQDNILEPFGGEVFGMNAEQTASFQPAWGGGVLIGMMIIGAVSVIFKIPKRRIALVGTIGTALGMATLAFAALTHNEALVKPSLTFMGFFTGFFNIGALSMMMDMTVEGATGLYMGLWGMAQAFGNGVASFGGGVLHTGLIETGLLSPASAYFVIFGLEATGMMVAGLILVTISVEGFHTVHQTTLKRDDTILAMEASMS